MRREPLVKSRTTVIVAHRLGTLDQTDRILTIDKRPAGKKALSSKKIGQQNNTST